MKKLGIGLIIMSCLLFLGIAVVPFLPLTLAQKGIITTVLFVSGEISWWAGVVIVGKQLIEKYKKYLDPRKWF